MNQESSKTSPKVQATSAIWGCAIGMLGVCIPIVAITESGILLPLLVALSASGGTAAVWFSPDKRQREDVHLIQQVKKLEERVIELETIYISLPDAENLLSLPEQNNHPS
ncbi:MAG: hypothetical protein AAFQ63_16915 [Cyanobacteria bacterium J06621_11]